MLAGVLIQIVSVVIELFIFIVFVSALLSFFVSPYHPVRIALDRIVDPFLAPIRQRFPGAGGLDFSPMILIFAAMLVRYVLIQILSFLR